MDFKQIEIELKELILRFKPKLKPGIIDSINEFIKSGEYGLALEELNNMLYEYDINISDIDYNDICKVCVMMKMSTDDWKFLKDLIK